MLEDSWLAAGLQSPERCGAGQTRAGLGRAQGVLFWGYPGI